MSALHQAVARAIADAQGSNNDAAWERAAAAAIGVVLAEATRSIEALPGRSIIDKAEALAALTALGEQA